MTIAGDLQIDGHLFINAQELAEMFMERERIYAKKTMCSLTRLRWPQSNSGPTESIVGRLEDIGKGVRAGGIEVVDTEKIGLLGASGDFPKEFDTPG